ncbi:hypothetical protein P4637_03415 [Halalkalibacterium halodurans]|nr:hypothetical protein [Halalkalibacterium halodurans]MED4105548.1 hypothetical protein [Halalkalibacterium halodurans]MED4109246.1 hypothetical protein [Halalkalibacterium halodurans]MED4149740.1 hypothetical protein [Halalkalibacterium halodurans]
MKLKLNVEAFNSAQKEMGLNNSELARKMNISRSRLWRAKLPQDHPYYCYPGEDFITGTLMVFRDKKFDELFFLENPCSEIHKEENNVS